MEDQKVVMTTHEDWFPWKRLISLTFVILFSLTCFGVYDSGFGNIVFLALSPTFGCVLGMLAVMVLWDAAIIRELKRKPG